MCACVGGWVGVGGWWVGWVGWVGERARWVVVVRVVDERVDWGQRESHGVMGTTTSIPADARANATNTRAKLPSSRVDVRSCGDGGYGLHVRQHEVCDAKKRAPRMLRRELTERGSRCM